MGGSEAEEQMIRRSLWNEVRTHQGVVRGGSEGKGGGGYDRGFIGRDGSRKGYGYGYEASEKGSERKKESTEST